MSALVLPFSAVSGLLAAGSIGLMSIGRADIVQISFLPVAAVLGLWAYCASPHHSFIGLIFSLWFYAPMARRLIDWQLGRTDASLIILAPYAVTALAWLSALKALRSLSRTEAGVFITYLGAVCFGGLNGIMRGHGASAIFDILAYLAPLGFGLHLIAARDSLSAVRVQLCRLLLLHATIIAAYGIVQFIVVPPWDAQWMVEAGIQSVGQPLPFLVRIYATLNAPGILAVILMVALLIATLEKPHRFILIAVPIAICLWLTLVRSAWGGAALGFTILMMLSPIRIKLDLLIGGLMGAGLLFIGAILLDVPSALVDRLATVFGLHEDVSLWARWGIIGDIVPAVLANPFGYGLGSTGISTTVGQQAENTFPIFDSGLLELTYAIGWAGFLIWGLLVFWLWTALRDAISAPQLLPISAALCALASQMMFFNILPGVAGVLFFTLLALAPTREIERSEADENHSNWS